MINLFFSYSHKDEVLRNELDKHLSILKRQGILDTYHDRRIEAGSEIHNEIDNYIKKADIILLLVSSDFLASDYCYEKETLLAIDRHNKGEAKVIPVILRPCDWIGTPFGKLLAVPTDGKPVIKFPTLDEGFLEVTNEIKRVATTLERPIAIKKDFNASVQEQRVNPVYRSGNLRISKKFSDQEKDLFLDEAFEYIASYFEASLKELAVRNSEIKYNFKRIDALSFTSVIYFSGEKKSECSIYYGRHGGLSKGINFSTSVNSYNSFNESFSVSEDEDTLSLKPIGMSTMMRNRNVEGGLTFEGAAEYYWQMLIEPLQKNY